MLCPQATNSIVRASPKDSVFFLNGRNREFGEKYLPTSYLNGHSNIVILYFEFFANQI
jgi:hypothetical protein